jgi:2-dehydro-3-deoxygluconokinase
MKIVTFGEIMGRFSPDGFLRLNQAMPGRLNITFAGAEANVAASLSILGLSTIFVTALPTHEIADACIANLKGLGINTDFIVRTEQGRLGIYFVEAGANQRPSKVVYDRSGASVTHIEPTEYDWDNAFIGAGWFHTTGITPSLSKIAADVALYAVKKAKKLGLTVSCDLNFRKKLWCWDDSLKPNQLAQKVMRELLPYVDVVIANEEDVSDVLDIHAGETDVYAGKLDIGKYPVVAKEIIKQFSNISKVAITLRESISATHNNWGATLFDRDSDQAFFAPLENGNYVPYQIKNIVDRVGGGDSFAAGLIFALSCDEYHSLYEKLLFAVSASCLAHSIVGDFNYSMKSEVEALMHGSTSGRVIR